MSFLRYCRPGGCRSETHSADTVLRFVTGVADRVLLTHEPVVCMGDLRIVRYCDRSFGRLTGVRPDGCMIKFDTVIPGHLPVRCDLIIDIAHERCDFEPVFWELLEGKHDQWWAEMCKLSGQGRI